MLKKIIFTSIAVLMLVSGIVACAQKPEAPGAIVVRAVSPFGMSNPLSVGHRNLLKIGNDIGQGKVVFQDLGGPEVYPPSEQLYQHQNQSLWKATSLSCLEHLWFCSFLQSSQYSLTLPD